MGNVQSNPYTTSGVCLQTSTTVSSTMATPTIVTSTVTKCTTQYASPTPSGAYCDIYGHLKKPAILTTTTLTPKGMMSTPKYQDMCDGLCNKNSQCDSFGYAVKDHVCYLYKESLSAQTPLSTSKYSSTIYFDKVCYTEKCKTQVKTVTELPSSTTPTPTPTPTGSPTCSSTPNPTYTSVQLNDPSMSYESGNYWEVDLPFEMEFLNTSASSVYISKYGHFNLLQPPFLGNGVPSTLPTYELSLSYPAIAVLWTNQTLVPYSGQSITYIIEGTSPNRTFTVTWNTTDGATNTQQYYYNLVYAEDAPQTVTQNYMVVSDDGIAALIGAQIEDTEQNGYEESDNYNTTYSFDQGNIDTPLVLVFDPVSQTFESM